MKSQNKKRDYKPMQIVNLQTCGSIEKYAVAKVKAKLAALQKMVDDRKAGKYNDVIDD